MIKDCILVFSDSPSPIILDDLFSLDSDSSDVHFTALESLEAKVDTRDFSLSFLGDMFPNIKKLRLNNSIIPSIRDIGCTLVNLRFLSLARCNIESLDGIATISQNLEELYLAFNKIKDVCDLMGISSLKIVDLEDNLIDNIDNIEVLNFCSGLRALTMAGNPAANQPGYRERVAKLLPQLLYLDEKRLRPKTKKRKIAHQKQASEETESAQNSPSKNINNDENVHKVNTQIDIELNQTDPNALAENILESALIVKEDGRSPYKEKKNIKTVTFAQPLIESVEFLPKIDNSNLTEEEKLDREHIMTELVEDLVEDRPTTSHGFYGNNSFKGINKKTNKSIGQGQNPKKIFKNSLPVIVRPMSAKERPI